MTYQLNFPALWPYLPQLLSGLWVTIMLAAVATVGGIAIGICGAAIRCSRYALPGRVWGIGWCLCIRAKCGSRGKAVSCSPGRKRRN